jgi:peroxiredoxin Q/BCP
MEPSTFELPDRDGNTRSLAEWRGRWVVLYFYPKDFTSGCTREARDFRDAAAQMRDLGATVVGVSRDTAASHARFDDENGLGFVLLSDPDLAVTKAFGAWGSKTMYGKRVQGVLRSTFLIDPAGEVAKAWRGVRVDGHVRSVLEQLERAREAHG